MASIGDLVVNLRADIASFRSDFQEASGHVKQLQGDLGGLKEQVKDVNEVLQGFTDRFRDVISFFGAGLGIREIADQTKAALEFTSALTDQAHSLGLNTTALQQYQFAARQAGISQEQLTSSFGALARNVGIATTPNASGQVNAQGARAIESLGIPLKDASGQLRPLSDLFTEIVEKLGTMQDKTRALADSMEIFGRGSGVAIMALAREDLPELLRQAQETGNVLDQSTVMEGEKLNKELISLSGTIKTQLYGAFVGLGPVLVSITKEFAEMAQGVRALSDDFTLPTDYAGLAPARLEAGIKNTTAAIEQAQAKLKQLQDVGASAGIAGRGGALGIFGGESFNQDAISQQKSLIEQLQRNLTGMRNALSEQTNQVTPAGAGIGVPAVAGASAAQRVIASLQEQVNAQKELTSAVQAGTPPAMEYAKAQAELGKELLAAKGATPGQIQQITALSAALEASKTQAADYAATQKEAAQTSGQAWSDYVNKFKSELAETQRVWDETRTPLEKYNEALDQYSTLLQRGLIDQDTFNRAAAQAQQNMQGHGRNSIGGAVEGALTAGSSKFIDALTSANNLKSGLQGLGNAALGLAQDFAKMILQLAIMNPLVDAATNQTGYLPTISSSNIGNLVSNVNLSGIDTNISDWEDALAAAGQYIGFAKGGVVSGATVFPMAGGMGLMGEAGPEAVVPLARSSSGELGIKSVGPSSKGGGDVIVNIHNSSGQQISQRSSTGPNGQRQLDVMIGESVARDFRGGGQASVAAKTQFGISRVPIER